MLAEGRAKGQGKSFEIGDLIGHEALLGQGETHKGNIVADSDGVVVAIRVVDILTLDRLSVKNKILMKVAEIYASSQIKRNEIHRTLNQFDTLEEKKAQRYLSKEWNSLVGALDPR